MAEMSGQQNVADTLSETLDEESAADETLTDIADGIINATQSPKRRLAKKLSFYFA